MPITTKSCEFETLNPAHGEVYSFQHYVIKFGSELRQDGSYFPGTPVLSTNKTDHHDISEILLKVALNSIILALRAETWKCQTHNCRQNNIFNIHFISIQPQKLNKDKTHYLLITKTSYKIRCGWLKLLMLLA